VDLPAKKPYYPFFLPTLTKPTKPIKTCGGSKMCPSCRTVGFSRNPNHRKILDISNFFFFFIIIIIIINGKNNNILIHNDV